VQLAAGAEQRHALLAARDEQRLERELAPQRLRAARHVGLVLPGAHHLTQLRAVRRDDRRTAIARIVVALRIDQHALLRAARELDHLPDVRHAALAVIGEQDQVALRQRGAILRELRGEHLARGGALEIKPHELLLAADDAQLFGRADRAVAVEVGLDAALLEQACELASGLVVADHRGRARARAKRGAVVRDVRRAAEPQVFLGLVDQHHRHRRLRRDARHVAVPVAIEHHVAHHQHAGLRCIQLFHCLRPIG